jgi:hypothetical protein
VSDDNELAGEVTGDGTAYWDPEIRKATWQSPIAPVEVRRELATSGRLSAVVDEGGNVIAFRVEPGISKRSRRPAGKRRLSNMGSEGRLEYGHHPGGRILAVQ